MKRLAALLTVFVGAAVAGSVGHPVAAAKEPAVVHATAALAVVGGEIDQPKLVWLHTQTLKQLKRGVVKLPGAFAVVMSPTRARAIAGSGGVGLEIVNVKQMKRVGQLARRAGWSVHPISWPVANRVLALEWNERLGQTLLVADPVARRPVKRISFNGFSTWVRAGNGVVAVGGPTDDIGPARLLAVDRNGNARTVVLERIQAGGRMEGTEEEPTYRTASPGLAFDSVSGHVYVVGQAPLVADIDLATLAVTYRELSPPRSLLGRFLEWLQPAAHGKIVNGWHRQVVALGEGRLAVAGSDYDRLRRSPSGLELVDVPSGTMRRLEGRASYALVASGMLLVAGDQGAGDGTWTGMGLAAHTLDGEKLWHTLDGEPVSWVQTAGGYAYVAGPDAYPPTVRVIDLADGSMRTLRGQLPMFVTD
jgi:hypothetical protein